MSIFLYALTLFLAVLLTRAALFRPAPQPEETSPDTPIDEARITADMQALIRCRTVSYRDKALEDPTPFAALPELLKKLYPALHAHCEQQRIGERGLLYRWPGKKSDAPSVMMAHYDVVPAEEAYWEQPPFAAVIEDGVLWGRGTLDTKGSLLGALEAAEALISQGFVPQQDVYLAFAGDEEIAGGGAPGIVAELAARGVKPAFVLDEGGAVVEGVFPGVKQPAALVGIGEKGIMDVTFTVHSNGGHASSPPPHTPVGVLARAVTRVEQHPFPFRLSPPAREMFDTLGRHSTFVYRLIFANLWCFAPVLNLLCRKSGGEMNALVRTTCAFTQMTGSEAANVLPPTASVGANLRLIGGDSTDSAVAHLQKLIHDDSVQVKKAHGSEPSPYSRTDGEPWQRLGRAIGQTWPGVIQSPYLMIAASDSRHYARISDCVYRFSAMALSSEERRTIHGHNERVPLEKLYTTVRFYQRLLRLC